MSAMDWLERHHPQTAYCHLGIETGNPVWHVAFALQHLAIDAMHDSAYLAVLV